MSANEDVVAAVMEALGCKRSPERVREVRDVCLPHYLPVATSPTSEHPHWTERGCPVAVKAADASVEALGLTEERCCDGAYADREEFGKYSVYTCGDEGRTCRTRLVSKWSQP
jgi:hypothetical protein